MAQDAACRSFCGPHAAMARKLWPGAMEAMPVPLALSLRVHVAVSAPLATEVPANCCEICSTQTGESWPLGLKRSCAGCR